ncbi:Hypothetical protein HDN1F_27960 [gamma proteobacterium HdN1]|nr:Hypothetical protein HDN1F_27960 [gamma proteobacterium HdN1]
MRRYVEGRRFSKRVRLRPESQTDLDSAEWRTWWNGGDVNADLKRYALGAYQSLANHGCNTPHRTDGLPKGDDHQLYDQWRKETGTVRGDDSLVDLSIRLLEAVYNLSSDLSATGVLYTNDDAVLDKIERTDMQREFQRIAKHAVRVGSLGALHHAYTITHSTAKDNATKKGVEWYQAAIDLYRSERLDNAALSIREFCSDHAGGTTKWERKVFQFPKFDHFYKKMLAAQKRGELDD